MMKKLFILACVCLLITSCNSNSKNTNDSATSTETTDMHNAENSLDYDGTYTGTFPAADCPGINMTLTIKKDKTFELISEYIDRQDATFKEYGTYSVEGNIITLINGEDKQYYKVGENTLTALNQDKQAITGELADHYILHKNKLYFICHFHAKVKGPLQSITAGFFTLFFICPQSVFTLINSHSFCLLRFFRRFAKTS